MEKFRLSNIESLVCPVFGTVNGKLTFLGSSFVVAAMPEVGVFMTAKHIFEGLDGFERISGRAAHSHPTALPEFTQANSRTRPIDPGLNVHAFIINKDNEGRSTILVADILYLSYELHSDGAVFIAKRRDDSSTDSYFRNVLAVDTRPAIVGSKIWSCGYSDTSLTIVETVESGKLTTLAEIRQGLIVETFPTGFPARRLGPSYRIDAPISSGMSGGPVIYNDDAGTSVACGINSSDLSVENNIATGEAAMVQMLWCLTALPLPNGFVSDSIGASHRVIDLIKTGFIHDRGDAAHHVSGIPKDSSVTAWVLSWE